MSWARSPRLVCSTTIGTSVVPRYSGSSNFFIWVMSLAIGRSASLCICRRIRCRDGFDFGVLREPVERFVTAQLSLHPIERALLCQTRANRFRRFAAMAGHVLEFVSDLLVRHVDAFRRCDTIDDQFGLHVILGALFLAAPQRHPVQIHRAWINALRGQ